MENILKSFTQSRNKNRNFIVLILVILLFGGGIIANLNRQDNIQLDQKNQQPSPTTVMDKNYLYTVIYGIWENKNSIIKAYDLNSKNTYLLASLPQNIKRITAVMPDDLYYINNTDENDHGKEIRRFSISSKNSSVAVTPDAGFKIDDYYISANGRYMTTWEIGLTQGSRQLRGGISRVYAIDLLTPQDKNLIYDEATDKPVHYPRGITDDGTVITDMFLPNSGPGWAYGMGSSDLTGQSKIDITSMANGTYGRQPRISYDGKQLAFAGYDGLNGPGTEQVQETRRAIIHPNTIEVMDSGVLQRVKLPNLSNKFIFDDVRFDPNSNRLFISQIKNRDDKFITTIRLYNLSTNETEEILNSVGKRGFAMLSDTQIFVGKPILSQETMGNLGETYQFINSKFELIDIKTGEIEPVEIPNTNLQYIGIYPNSIMPGLANPEGKISTDTLQLHTFLPKPELLSTRRNLQSASNVSKDVKGTIDVENKDAQYLAQAGDTSLPPEIEQIAENWGRGEFDPEDINKLINWLRNLLGIQELESQN